MRSFQYLVALVAAVSPSLAAPTNASVAQDFAETAGQSARGPSDIVIDNGYTVMANAYNANPQAGVVGRACATSHGHNKQGIQWSSTWKFNADPSDTNPVKAYPNAYNPKAHGCKKAKNINAINSFWQWSYNDKGKFTADVSYDMFLKSGSIAPGADCTPQSEYHHYEVMIWLTAIGQRTYPNGRKGPFRPLGRKLPKGDFKFQNHKGRDFHFELFKGRTTLSIYKEFDADLAPFLHDRAKNHEKAVGEATLQSILAGTEAVEADYDAKSVTHAYSIS